MQRDGITREKALEWMGRQWPQEQVVARSHFEIINDGRPLEPQIESILTQINN
jgi:dephospho-CoA kinase